MIQLKNLMYNTKMIKNTPQTKSSNLLVLFTLVVAFCCINLYGCNKPEQKGEPPKKLAEAYLEYVKNGQPEKAIALYTDKMFQMVPKENWLKTLSIYRDYYGSLKSYELQHKKQVKNDTKEYGGIYSYLVYKIEYDKKANQEVFAIRQPADGGAIELAGHYMNIDVVEPEKLLERIFSEQSGESTSEKASVIDKAASDKTVVQTMKIENSPEQSSEKVDASKEEKK